MKLNPDVDFVELLESDVLTKKFLAKAVIELGAKALINMVNEKLINPHFTVRFENDDPVSFLNDDEYSYLNLYSNILVVNKPSQKWVQDALKMEIEKIVDLDEIEETESRYKFLFSTGVIPYANTIDEIIWGINDEIGPMISKGLAILEIEDYQVQFSINKSY
ncbi:hypothetical protein [Solibacillus sp. FSL K6-1554]|uniref:hypothetical protein n=1 Tax=Solibacillus sp. FSL K6-1554 TaxID=2921472 RepID=UPI0030F701A6